MAGRLNKRIPSRSFAIIAFSMIAWAILIGRLAYLQIISYDKYQTNVIDNVQRETQVAAQRGVIYDRNMIQLATNATVWRVFISPRDITDTEQAQLIANKLSEILDVSVESILEKTAKTNRADETIKKNVEEDKAKEILTFIDENDLDTQIHLEALTKRYYPYGNLASHVVGFMGTDGGLLGLELQYNTELTGIPGRYIVARSGSGSRMPFKYDSYVDAKNGLNLVTTIDMTMQYMLENQLKQTFTDSIPLNRVVGIIMDVNTGAVYAMATYPDFDCNSPYILDEYSQSLLDKYANENSLTPESEEYNTYYWKLVYSMWKNKAVSEVYEPGSTFKIITTSMALEEKVVKLDEMLTCTGAYFVEGYKKPIHCHVLSGHGTVPFAYGLQQSCNPILMQVAGRIGRANFYKYFQAYGYTDKTGIDLPGEAYGIYHSYSGFNQVELAVYSFGQTFKTTPIQHLTAICAVANGGYLVTPHIVDSLVDDKGSVVKKFENEIKRQVVSTEVCNTISGVLEEGVSGNGGAKNAYVSGYKIAAKTGTSEVRDMLNEFGESYLRVGSCVAYAPSDDPQIAMIIVVDQPQCLNVYGSIVAAPYIAKLMDQILPNLGVERSYTEEELKKLHITIPNVSGWSLEEASSYLKNKHIKYEVVGSDITGEIVKYQIPPSGSSVSKDTGKIILYTGDDIMEHYITVPNVVGTSAQRATRSVINAGLNILTEGATNSNLGAGAVVFTQSPAAGESVPYGSVVTITLRYMDGTAN